MGANCHHSVRAVFSAVELHSDLLRKPRRPTMTVFTRTVGQSFRIGDLLVTVKAIEAERVVFEFENSGFDRIQRSELYGILLTPRQVPIADATGLNG